jgi:hypothetical protein
MIGAGAVVWLDLWERAMPKPPRLRRRELLASSGLLDARSPEQLEVGRANAELLRLHCSMFGPRLACHTTCPECGVALELDLDAEELLVRTSAEPARPMQIEVGPWQIEFRLPTEGDIDAAHGESDPAKARDEILRRCVTRCRCGGEESSISLAPPAVIALMSARMDESDPLAILDFELRCAGCDHAWSSILEVDAFLFTRLGAWVHRLLRDVHTLARAYGWDERTITEMSPWKRQLYLDMVEECATS